jgi:hypothetical protein
VPFMAGSFESPGGKTIQTPSTNSYVQVTRGP